MDFLKVLMQRNILIGLAVGLGVTVVAPIALPIAVRVGKPFAKAAVKSVITLYEKGRETIAEMGEVAEDIVAEARAELAEEVVAEEAAIMGATAASVEEAEEVEPAPKPRKPARRRAAQGA
ncbi:MAG: DUF5132 domain-containing protein [Magnetospirillum sp. WYHS-4]